MDARTPMPVWARGSFALAIAVAGLLGMSIGSATARTVTVAAVNFQFQPASRTVSVGDVVHWTFAGDPHSVTSGVPGAPDGRFDSGVMDPGGSFQVTFDTPGTYRYFCQVHSEQMTGTIVVTAGSGSTPTPRPSAKPTARPTAKPSVRPTTRPTATSSASASATSTASATASPTSSAAASATATPRTVAPASPSASVVSAPSTAPSGPPATPDSASSVSPVAIAGAVVVLGLLAAGALILARRGRSA